MRSRRRSCARVADELGPVDVLVNNAAACFYLPIDETSERRLRVAYEVNAITPYLLTKAAVPGMRERGEGWIVNIASVIADSVAAEPEARAQFARASTYAPSKASLNRLTEALATELGPTGIAVNAVAPEMAVATEGATRGDGPAARMARADRGDGRGRARARDLRRRPTRTGSS